LSVTLPQIESRVADAPSALAALPPVAVATRGADLGYLPGLDGLRALSVLAIVLFHAQVAGFDGGFFGVEVFFVLSGYLITSLLVAEFARTGGVSLRRFWMRRARRLLPALCMLLISVVAVAPTLAPDAYLETRGALPAALLFVSNWWQIAHHQSYFMAVERPPFLLHLWSLAVEEQFYIVVPPIVVCACALSGRLPRGWIAATAAFSGLASAFWMAHLFDPSVDPSAVYLRTDTRLSGLLLGVAMAAIVPAGTRGQTEEKARFSLDALGLLGLAGLSWALCRWRDTDPFVYPFGFLAVDIAAMALIACAVGPSRVGRLLGLAPLRWLGRRSYGLYLWHWPVMVVTRPELDVPWTGWQLLALRLGVTLLLAELSYRFVELPVQRGALTSLLRSLRGYGSPLERTRALRTLGVMTGTAGLAAALVSAAPVHADGSHETGPAGAALHPEPPAEGRPGAASEATSPFDGIPLDPSWPKTLMLLTDSVTLGVKTTLPAALPDWNVEVVGRPALMVKQVVPEFLKNRQEVPSVVVIGVAYNSLFEKNRKNYDRWAALWDKEAERLLSDLRARGAKKFVWVTLREPSPAVVTDRGRSQYQLYAWFFPYVNERLRALVVRHPEVALADWRAVSDKPGVTYDLIHLSSMGAKLMTRIITDAVLGPSS
jgi:peptidoglycan/LPS O-acetylase OafA/YrhL